jgi:hypothetical protein
MDVHTRRAAAVALFVLLASAAPCAAASAANAEIAPPAGSDVVRVVEAGGAQVYACRQAPTGTYQWALVGPNAILVNEDGTSFGTHSAGPTWTAADGSAIVADGAHPLVVVKRTEGVPALLLSVTSSTGTGILNGVRFVRRSDTEGGFAPAADCDAAHLNATVAKHYSAIYTFYR